MPSEERRSSERFCCENPVSIERCHTGTRYDGSIYNYSRGGLYIELDYFIEPGSKIRILSQKPEAHLSSEICTARVVWSKEIHEAVVLYNFGMGARYDPSTNLASWIKNFKIIDGGATSTKPLK